MKGTSRVDHFHGSVSLRQAEGSVRAWRASAILPLAALPGYQTLKVMTGANTHEDRPISE
jgi:hypothetical protein